MSQLQVTFETNEYGQTYVRIENGDNFVVVPVANKAEDLRTQLSLSEDS